MTQTPYIAACMSKIQTMADKEIIFLDNASTTLVDEEVIETFNKVKKQYFANPSSIHLLGQEADRLLLKARTQILHLFNIESSHELIFTSGATEGNNLAIKGYCLYNKNRGKHIITSNIEHPSVLEIFYQLRDYFGFDITVLPVNEAGIIEVKQLKDAIKKETILVSLMAVNNEIGSINPIKEIAALLKDYPLIAFHVDATQAIGKIDLPYQDIDMFTFSGHKIHGLNSSGCLLKRKNINLLPLFSGGGQENNYRSGTSDVALFVSLAKALRLSLSRKEQLYEHAKRLSSLLVDYLLKHPDLYVLNSKENVHIVNFSLLNKKASVVVEALSNAGIMVSSVSACHAKEEPISYVVQAIKHNELLAHNTIRVSVDLSNNENDIKRFISSLEKIVEEVK